MIFWVILKIVLVSLLGLILFQDVKERKVYWLLFPLTAICFGLLHLHQVLHEVFLLTVIYNLVFVLLISLFTFGYIKLKLRKNLTDSFGLGDFLFFLATAFSFATFSFISIFVLSLIFSLSLHLILKKITHDSTVPLAGYMSLFFILTYIGYWTELLSSMYLI